MSKQIEINLNYLIPFVFNNVPSDVAKYSMKFVLMLVNEKIKEEFENENIFLDGVELHIFGPYINQLYGKIVFGRPITKNRLFVFIDYEKNEYPPIINFISPINISQAGDYISINNVSFDHTSSYNITISYKAHEYIIIVGSNIKINKKIWIAKDKSYVVNNRMLNLIL